MAMHNVAVSAVVALALTGDNSGEAGADLGTCKDSVNISRGLSYTDGSGSDQCDVFWHDELAVTTGDKPDLNGAVFGLKDSFGESVAMDHLKVLFIHNKTGGELLVGGGGANSVALFDDVSDILAMPDGSQFLMVFPGDGLDVSVNDELMFAHAVGGAQAVEIIVAGTR